MFNHLIESSHRDDSNKWSNIGFVKELTQIESIEVQFTHLIWSSATLPIRDSFLSIFKKNNKKNSQVMIHEQYLVLIFKTLISSISEK